VRLSLDWLEVLPRSGRLVLDLERFEVPLRVRVAIYSSLAGF